MATPLHLVWHRAELRTHDHPALVAALKMAQSGGAVVPVVIIDDAIFNRPDLTPRRQAHFLENVRALRETYRELGADLVVRRGIPEDELLKLAEELGDVFSIHFVKTYTSYAKKRDAATAAGLANRGIEIHAYGGQYTHEPGEVTTNSGGRYGVFGPYRKKWQTLDKPDVLDKPDKLPPLPAKIKVGDIPVVKSDIALPDAGEDAALGRLQWFLDNGEATYEKTRNEPGREDSTSKLSYYFNIGVLSPRLAFERANLEKWKQELTWWDFYADVLDRAPESNAVEYRADWREFPWREGQAIEGDLERWKKRPNRLSARRCRNARIATNRFHAQPRAHDLRLVFDQTSAHRLENRRRDFSRVIVVRRPRAKRRQLAMGGRLRRRSLALFSRFQSDRTGRKIR